ncbi:MAG: preprotein translocase subunit SecE [Bacilli bacterium]|nr:preprotein translocase subunit SecE [Bacilli bacterium]
MAKKEEKAKKDVELKETKSTKDVKSKDTKKDNKKSKKDKAPKENFFAGVRLELAKVKWPTKQEVLKYTVATIVFVVVLVAFFVLMSLVMSLVKGAFN